MSCTATVVLTPIAAFAGILIAEMALGAGATEAANTPWDTLSRSSAAQGLRSRRDEAGDAEIRRLAIAF